ncbi:hypothetical protein [Acidisoma cellulosilyticum]|nr:hypothetical protein [Acidisoma cellulosilyticum]
MKFVQVLTAFAMVLAIAACAEKPVPHKLTNSAPGDGSAPSQSSW